MQKNNDVKFMKEALRLAALVTGTCSPDPAVGAVIVKNNRIISKGYHDRFTSPHAEEYAIKKADKKAKGATLYINLEPCCHYGNNPPCTGNIIKSGIKRVVAAMRDPNPLVCGKGFKILRKAGIGVTEGILEKEAAKLNEFFVKHIKTKRPFVILKTAMSLDGKIATKHGESFWITGDLSRKYAHELRSGVDAIMAGIGTVRKDNPLLTARLNKSSPSLQGPDKKGGTKNPARIIIDGNARIPLSSSVLNDSSARTIVVVTKGADKNRVKKISAKGADIITAKSSPIKSGAGSNSMVDLQDVMKKLGRMDISAVLLEGGGNLAAGAIESKIVDKAVFFIAPKIIGGKSAPTPVEGSGIDKLKKAFKIKDISIKRLGEDIVIEGYFEKGGAG